MPPRMMLDVDEVDTENSVCMTWSIDPSGTMRHRKTGTKVSTKEGITFEGTEYRLSPEDIELEPDSHLGAGACGVVMKGVIKQSGIAVAVKTVKVDDQAKREQLINEIRGLVAADGCVNLVHWYAGFMSKRTMIVHVALEFMDLGSLADLKKRLGGYGVEPVYLSNITAQIMNGLDYLHKKKMLHRDIKPENILHNRQGEVKLTDFGIAKDLDQTLAMAGTFVGTVTYMSPERCLGQDYSFASDIWSVGMVIFELSTGRYPFADVTSFVVLFDHLCEQPEPRLDPEYFPAELVEFDAYCLTRDVSRRPDTEFLLAHPFVTYNVPTVEQLDSSTVGDYSMLSFNQWFGDAAWVYELRQYAYSAAGSAQTAVLITDSQDGRKDAITTGNCAMGGLQSLMADQMNHRQCPPTSGAQWNADRFAVVPLQHGLVYVLGLWPMAASPAGPWCNPASIYRYEGPACTSTFMPTSVRLAIGGHWHLL